MQQGISAAEYLAIHIYEEYAKYNKHYIYYNSSDKALFQKAVFLFLLCFHIKFHNEEVIQVVLRDVRSTWRCSNIAPFKFGNPLVETIYLTILAAELVTEFCISVCAGQIHLSFPT